ncbi:metallopeptidase family protein [Patescibacteria group bacterium]|nr:metallopeptidase family protein [Patescibacteria group bacterium]
MDQGKFEQMVTEGINAIPEKFLEKLSNVAIVIEDEPSSEQIKKINLCPQWALFGLYEGIPQSSRGVYYSHPPDKITIFKKSIEEQANNDNDVKEIVKNTVWHEIAHHFGMNEERVERAEKRRRIK